MIFLSWNKCFGQYLKSNGIVIEQNRMVDRLWIRKSNIRDIKLLFAISNLKFSIRQGKGPRLESLKWYRQSVTKRFYDECCSKELATRERSWHCVWCSLKETAGRRLRCLRFVKMLMLSGQMIFIDHRRFSLSTHSGPGTPRTASIATPGWDFVGF